MIGAAAKSRLRALRPAFFLALLCTPEAVSHAADSKDACPSFYGRVVNYLSRPAPNPNDYLGLRETSVSSYFPETETIEIAPKVMVVGAKLDDEAVKTFYGDWDRLLDVRAKIFGLPAEKFRDWLKTKSKTGVPYPDLDPLYLEQGFKAAGATLEDMQNALFLAFAKEKHGPDVGGFLKTLHLKEVARLSFSFTKLIGSKTKAIVAGALIAGPAAAIVNNLLSAPMKPVLESSEQFSNLVFPDVAQYIQSVVSGQMKKMQSELADLEATTKEFDQYNLSNMSREEAKRIMDQFEQRYYKIFLRMHGHMPGYKRQGRDVVRDWLVLQPLQLATATTTFENQYTMNKSLYDALNEKIKARGTPPTAEEKNQMRIHLEAMETAENRLAVALASWKIYSMMFAEVARESKDANAILMGTLKRYESFMNMDKYRQELSGKIKEAFFNFDPSFKGLDALEQRESE